MARGVYGITPPIIRKTLYISGCTEEINLSEASIQLCHPSFLAKVVLHNDKKLKV